MKNKLLILTGLVLCLSMLLFIRTGFKRHTDIALKDYSISDNGSSMTLNVELTGSIGYLRDCKVTKYADSLYVTFYSTFGWLNSSLGSHNIFDVKVNKEYKKVYIYKGKGAYNLVLQRVGETNNWVRTEYKKGGKGLKF